MKLYIKNERTIVSKSQWNILNWLRIDDDIGLLFDDNKWKMINLRQSKICKKTVRYMQYAWTTYGNLIDDHSADRSAKMVLSMTKILSKQSRIVFIIEFFEFLKGFANKDTNCFANMSLAKKSVFTIRSNALHQWRFQYTHHVKNIDVSCIQTEDEKSKYYIFIFVNGLADFNVNKLHPQPYLSFLFNIS